MRTEVKIRFIYNLFISKLVNPKAKKKKRCWKIIAKITPVMVKTAIVLASVLLALTVYFLIRSSPEKCYAKAARNSLPNTL